MAKEDLFTKMWKMGSGFLAVDGGRRLLASDNSSERIVGTAELVVGVILYRITE